MYDYGVLMTATGHVTELVPARFTDQKVDVTGWFPARYTKGLLLRCCYGKGVFLVTNVIFVPFKICKLRLFNRLHGFESRPAHQC